MDRKDYILKQFKKILDINKEPNNIKIKLCNNGKETNYIDITKYDYYAILNYFTKK